MADTKKETKAVEKYTKQQIVSAKKYKKEVDILQAVLSDEQTYSLQEVETAIENFKKGKVG